MWRYISFSKPDKIMVVLVHVCGMNVVSRV